MIGGVIAFLPIIKSYDLKLLMPYAGLTLNLYSIFFISGDGFPGWSALLPTVGTAMIIWAGVGRAESRLAFDNLFSWRPIQWTGDISYSIYLWHFPLIIILPILLHYDISGKYGTFFKAGIVALTLILAQLSYRYVEQATQRIRTETHCVYIIFAIATSLVVAVSIGLKYHTENRIDATLRDVHAAVLDESNTCFGARAILHQVKCGNPYGKINTAYATAGQQDIWFNLIRSNRPCYAFYAGKKGRENVQEYCTFGDQKADRSIALVGDSHAEQYVNTFDSIGLRNHYKIYLLNALPCITNWDTMKQNSLCKDRLDSMLSLLATIHKSSTESFIVASSLFLRYDDVKAFLNTLKRSTKMKTVLLKDEPRSDEKRINDCYISRTNCVISRARATKETTEIASNLIKNGVVSNEDIINLDNAFCNSTNCFSFIGGAPVYYNTNKADYGVTNSHITASYSLSLSFIVEHELQERRLLK